MAFQPGRTGNPKGRPRGVPDKRGALRAMIIDQAPELIQLAMDAAKAGDTAALSLLLARAVPPLRPVSDPVAFDMPAGASLADQARAILTGVAAGRIDPIIGKALVDAVAAVANVAALDEIERRLSALEDGGSKDVR